MCDGSYCGRLLTVSPPSVLFRKGSTVNQLRELFWLETCHLGGWGQDIFPLSHSLETIQVVAARVLLLLLQLQAARSGDG